MAADSNIDTEYRIVMIGKTGTGKSSLGNSILSYKDDKNRPFLSQTAASSVTKKCQRGFTHLQKHEHTLIVIDTPGIFDTSTPNEDIISEIVKCVALATPGPNLFLFVLSLRRLTKEDVDSIEVLKSTFGKDVLNFAAVVFTGKDEMEYKDIKEYIDNGPQYLKDLTSDCGGRYVAICTKKSKAKNYKQDVKDVLHLITNTIKSLNYSFYKERVFEVADNIIEEEVETRLKREPKKTQKETKEEVKFDIEKKDSDSEQSGLWGLMVDGVKSAIPLGIGWARKALNI